MFVSFSAKVDLCGSYITMYYSLCSQFRFGLGKILEVSFIYFGFDFMLNKRFIFFV